MIALFAIFALAFSADPSMQIFKGDGCSGNPIFSTDCALNQCCAVNNGLAYFKVDSVANGQAVTHVCKNNDCATQCIVNGAVACGGCGTLMTGAASFKVICPAQNEEWSDFMAALNKQPRVPSFFASKRMKNR